MGNAKLYEVHVFGRWPDRFYVVNLKTGERYPQNQFPKSFEGKDITYLNSIVEMVPEDGTRPEDGTYCLGVGSWPFHGVCLAFNATDAFHEDLQEFNDRIALAGILKSNN